MDRVYINKNYRKLITDLSEKNILSFKLLDTKDIFMFAAALGYKTNKTMQNRDGYVQLDYFQAEEKAIAGAISLTNALENKENIDAKVNYDSGFSLCEKFTEEGFEKLQNLIIESRYDKELIRNKLISNLDLLFESIEN